MYLFFFCILLFCSVFFYSHPNNTNYKNAKLLALLFYIGIAGLRYNLGIDYFAYSDSYQNGDTLYQLFLGKHDPEYEPLYDFTCMTLRTLRLDSQMFFLLFSIFSSIVLFKVLDKFVEKKYFFFSLLVYFCFVYLVMEMQAVRQSLAAAFLYLSFLQLLNSKKKSAYAFLIVGFMFHSSALFMLLIFPFLDKKLKISIQLFLIFFSLFVVLFEVRWIFGIIESISAFFPGAFFAARLLGYTTSNTTSFERGLFVTFFIYLLFYIYIIYKNRKNRGYFHSPSCIIAQNLFLYYLIFTSLFWELSFISTRMGWYLLFGFVISLPNMLSMCRPKQKIYGILFIIFFCLIPFRNYVIPSEATALMVPYEGYIECNFLGVESTGRERVKNFSDEQGLEFRY